MPDDPTTARRLAVCESCEHNVHGRCRKAGRHVQVLVRAEEPACPDGRWPEQRPATEATGKAGGARRAKGQRGRGAERDVAVVIPCHNYGRCPDRAGGRCPKAGRHCASHARDRDAACPREEWPGERNAENAKRRAESRQPPAGENGQRATGHSPRPAPPRVDVILPYSGAYLRWVPLCLETLRMQVGVRPIVHLIADGLAESEDPLRWRYAGCRDVHVYSSMDNVGPYVQANRVAGRLTAEWLAIADADDWYFPDRFERQIARLQAEGADIIGSSAWNLLDPDDPEDNELVARRYASHRGRVAPSGRYNSRRLCPGGNVLNPTMTLRQSCFLETGGFANWAYGADWDFVGRAEHAGYAVVRENYDVEGRAAIVGVHRMHARSLTANEATGINTPARRERNQEIEARTAIYKAGGYDPRDYGGLRDCRPERTVRVF